MHLVFYLTTYNVKGAIARERQIKEGLRKRKMALIESVNPDWVDLAVDWDLEFRISNPRELHLFVMLNEVKHLVFGTGECFLPATRFFVALLLRMTLIGDFSFWLYRSRSLSR